MKKYTKEELAKANYAEAEAKAEEEEENKK